MAYFGKKFQKSKVEELTPDLLAAMKVDERFAKSGGTLNTFLKNDDGSYSLVFEVEGKVVAQSNFRSGVETTSKASDGSDASTVFKVEGNTLTQTQTLSNGVVITYVREFQDNSIKMTITASGVAAKGTVYYDVVA